MRRFVLEERRENGYLGFSLSPRRWKRGGSARSVRRAVRDWLTLPFDLEVDRAIDLARNLSTITNRLPQATLLS
jgi:hypothetical protein